MKQFWVLQVVGSNPAAPTKNTVDSFTFFPRDSDTRFLRCSVVVCGARSAARLGNVDNLRAPAHIAPCRNRIAVGQRVLDRALVGASPISAAHPHTITISWPFRPSRFFMPFCPSCRCCRLRLFLERGDGTFFDPDARAHLGLRETPVGGQHPYPRISSNK
ncbi:MAG: hypothetical protein JWP25_6649 [Bradyrhizobium sp.]|nr:hypothetical protein [Bradyrhizobium sp.]